uniref:Uncharacterized protein n=2 Tax=viral metagenome TaxID=1070528 RepID=A0A6M3JJ20_9ZZZZ
MRGGDLFKTKTKKQIPIPKESKRRKRAHVDYRAICQELWNELVATGRNVCFFCNKEMKKKEGFHHVKGKVEENYLERKWLYPAHNDCHVWHYHQANIEQLMREDWYEGFLEKLRLIDTQSYYKEKNKLNKAELYFEDNSE